MKEIQCWFYDLIVPDFQITPQESSPSKWKIMKSLTDFRAMLQISDELSENERSTAQEFLYCFEKASTTEEKILLTRVLYLEVCELGGDLRKEAPEVVKAISNEYGLPEPGEIQPEKPREVRQFFKDVITAKLVDMADCEYILT